MIDSPALTRRPTIGLTLDYETNGGYSAMPWFAIRENYCTSVTEAGGVPMPLTSEIRLVEDYLDRIDGLITTGGNFDVPPEYYGQTVSSPTVTTKAKRTEFEFAIMRAALARDMPLLSICGGQQLLNVVLGGTLIQHIPDSIENALEHEQPNPRTEPGHTIAVLEGSLLHRVTNKREMAINSAHHQAVAQVAPGIVVSATAPDGVIEAIEDPARPFCLGVQWHPEYWVDSADATLFDAFVAAARDYASQR